MIQNVLSRFQGMCLKYYNINMEILWKTLINFLLPTRALDIKFKLYLVEESE